MVRIAKGIAWMALLLPLTVWALNCPSPSSLQFKSRGLGCSITASSGGVVFNGGNGATPCANRVAFSHAIWPSVKSQGISCVYKGDNGIGYTLILNTQINAPEGKEHWFCNSVGGKPSTCKCNSNPSDCAF